MSRFYLAPAQALQCDRDVKHCSVWIQQIREPMHLGSAISPRYLRAQRSQRLHLKTQLLIYCVNQAWR